jgi:hypothetical protein
MTSEERLANLQAQFDEIWTEGRPKDISCPYCYHVTPRDSQEPPCCYLMHQAAKALIERAARVEEGLRKYEQREFGRQIMGDRYRI